jgi:radical SAM protein with 4Fe4S-binding SPASM domain
MEDENLFNFVDIYRTLKYIEVETCSACTRKCKWCLHGNKNLIRKNQNIYLETEYIKKVYNELHSMGFNGTIALYSINEPLMDERIRNGELIKMCKTVFEKKINVVIITNADLLDYSVIEKMFQAGLDKLSISCYSNSDYEKALNFKINGYNIEILDQRRFLTGKWESNRAGAIEDSKLQNNSSCCYAPFFRTVIGWDGGIRICPHEMLGVNKIGNIKEEKLSDILIKEEYIQFRRKLLVNRNDVNPCSKCNLEGGLEYSLGHLNSVTEIKDVIKYMKKLKLKMEAYRCNDITKVDSE